MSVSAMLWSSSPSSSGRPSSPLNPHAHAVHPSSSHASSSSPTPPSGYASQTSLGSPLKHRSHPCSQSQSRAHTLRYPRPARRHSDQSSQAGPITPRSNHTTHNHSHHHDIFAEGATPVGSAMWKERLARRVQDRERRRRARELDLERRRGSGYGDPVMDEEEADRQAQADDEEIFRRLVILQKRRATHAQLVSHEIETGGSDPLLPDFWADELDLIAQEERNITAHLHDPHPDSDTIMASSPFPGATPTKHAPRQANVVEEEEEWAREAAEAEQAERDAEEAEIAQRIEEAYGMAVPPPRNHHLDMDWDAFDAMDIE